MTNSNIITKLISKPHWQALLGLFLNLVFGLVLSSLISSNSLEDDGIVIWEFSFAILLGYMMFNSIFSLKSENKTRYFASSIFSFILLAALGGFIATKLSGLPLSYAGSFEWLYVVFTFVYLVFISIINMMGKIIEYAKKQDSKLRGEN